MRTNGLDRPSRPVGPGFLAVCLLVMGLAAFLSARHAGAAPASLPEFVEEYRRLAKEAMPLVSAIREARSRGEYSDRDEILLMRKKVGDLLKAVRHYHQQHAIAERRKGVPYTDRADVLIVLRATDEMNRVLDAEMRANDWIRLTLKHEDAWKQAHADVATIEVSR